MKNSITLKLLGMLSAFWLVTAVGCSLHSRATHTPVPEISMEETPSQPAHGVAGADSIGDAYIPNLGNTGYDVQAYLIDMAFSSQIDYITATVTITSAVTMNDLDRLSLDFSGYQLDGVQVDGKYAGFYRSPGKLYVDLPASYAQDQPLVLRVSYHGPITSQDAPYISGFPLGLRTYPADNQAYAVAEPNGAHDWFPCNDHPLDKAAYTFNITVPEGLTAVANGTLLKTSSNGARQTFTWQEKFPMASYLATVVVGRYQRLEEAAVGGVKIRHYVLEGGPDYSGALSYTREMLDYFTRLIGPYPFDEFGFTFIHTEDDQKRFAEETQTMVMVDAKYMQSEQAVGVLAHELAHHWFGDAVSLASWNEVWLKEGVATYLMAMWLDHQGLVSLADMMTELEDSLVSQADTFTYPMDQPPYAAMYGPSTYNKAAWVYHMLRQQIGEESFSEFLRQYYQRYNGGNASMADVQSLAEAVSGMDLSTFFAEWVYGPGLPNLSLSWVDTTSGVSIQVCQAGSGQVYTFPLEIDLLGSDGSLQAQVIPVDQLQEQVNYSTPFPVMGIQVDPGQKVLAGITVQEAAALTSCTP